MATVAARDACGRLPGRSPGTARILMTGDVMLGRGIDQVLPFHSHPRIYESCVQDARGYVKLAATANGPLPEPRGFDYPWGIAVQDMEQHQPNVKLINLETAVTTYDRPWPHKPINYRMHPGNVETLRSAGIQVCSLANNHVLDWCEPGLLETLDALEQAGVQYAGAGRNAEQAQRPAIVHLPAVMAPTAAGAPTAASAAASQEAGTPGPDFTVSGAAAAGQNQLHHRMDAGSPELGGAGGSMSSAWSGSPSPKGRAGERQGGEDSPVPTGGDHEGGLGGRVLIWAVGHASSGVPDEWAATAGRPGVFVTDLSERDVKHLGELVRAEKRLGQDVAVVSVHWGSNWGYDVPKEQQHFARALINTAGVDVVHGHSSHHAKGFEIYHGKLIMYGAGDLISDYEGITNTAVEVCYPPEWYRDDVGVLWYADVSMRDGTLSQLTMTPTRLRHMRLEQPEPQDLQYIYKTLDRESRKLGGEGVEFTASGASLVAVMPEEGGSSREA
ncbi:hypothetical protein N2152v2_005107 [Parachlorella kessleri]